ncbi:efflux RND transporter periplasmic adaptor subunit [Grimontia sp. NTOU-MAR1]|uniref:efflux RND transporter periplasmic adaptor subunit n=1 Tax=Grimontia sp. NTOU-MAR1 TaxID=3111011 RepID=UPI002DBD1CF4|nr:HlyD family secretion protein [Grimontia sp. NTOU-MAR1]WRV96299.1 HlyD family secretion protein [Grimontia sp. NTOU-MAR1]
MTLRRKLLFFPALAVGIAVLFFAINSRPDVPVKPAQSKARAVDVITLQQSDIAPVVTGFGRVTPKLTWQAIAEVNGKVIYRNPALEKGRVLPAGTELLRIDPTDYQLAVAQAQADVSVREARLAKLSLDEKNLKTTLAIEQRRLALSRDELTRQKNLRQKGLTSQSDLDNEQQAFLSQQTRVQDLEAQLKVLPDEKRITESELEASNLALEQAQRNLDKTQIVLPVDSRIAEVNIERDQVVTPQQVMVIAHGLGAVEVDAQVSIHDMQTVFDTLNGEQSEGFAEKLHQLNASVNLSSGSFKEEWPAKVARLSDTVSLNQATVGVILEIALNEEQKQGIAAQPSLVNGMFVKATIEGKPVSHWVIPERALRGDKIYLMEDGALKVMPVTILFRRGESVAIAGDLKAGQQLVLNDLLPAVPGMELRAVTPNGDVVESNVVNGEAS